MKVVIAHNRYVSAQPSGENSVVDNELGLLAEAGVEVVPFLRTSDEIATMSAGQKALLPISPLYAGTAQRQLRDLLAREKPDVLHLHNPYPLLSPWVVRTAHAAGVPVVHTVHNFRQVCVAGTYFRDGHPCYDCRGKSFGYPGILHGCYRGSRAQSAIMASTLAAHRGTWRSVDRFIALTTAMAAHLRSYGIQDSQIVVKPNCVPDPGTHSVTGSGFLYV
ncbi:MAG: glycosyltransferase family 4 protein, partial [Micromonosporaceae bacterium]